MPLIPPYLVLAAIATAAAFLAASSRPAFAETADEIVAKHFDSQRVGGVSPAGERPLAIALLQFSDRKISQPRSYFDGLTFGTGGVWPNIRSVFRNSSYGRFTWSRAGVWGPFEHRDDPRTTADETRRACVLDNPAGCSGVGLVTFSLPDNDTSDDNDDPFFLGATGGGGAGSVVDATARAAGEFERFALVDRNRGELMDGDAINLVAYEDYYLSAEGGGGREISANRTAAREWERFVVVKREGDGDAAIRSGDGVALRTLDGRYVSAIGGGGGGVVANRTKPAAWETFTLTEEAHDSGRLNREALRLAAENGLNFAAYAGSDRLLEPHEFAFVRVLADDTNGAACCNARRLHIPGQDVTVHPSLVRAASETFGISLMAHELTHAIAVDQHIYGTNNNSFELSLFSTGSRPTATFHHDPWWKFLLGWLRPAFVRADLPLNGCRYVLPADDASSEFLHGTTPASTAPFLLHRPDRRGEYYFVEYRKQEGDDRDAASTGLVLWLIKTRPDGRLAEVEGQMIHGGEDGLDSTAKPGSDDVVRRGGFDNTLRVYPGADRHLDSAVVGNDTRPLEPVDVAIGAPGAVTRREFLWGGNRAWTAADGLIQPFWLDGTPTDVRLQAGIPAGLPGTAMPIEIAVGGPFKPKVSSTSSSIVLGGSTLTLNGMLGVRGGKRVLAKDAAGKIYQLPIVSWSGCERTTVRIPTTLPTGSYQVYVEGDHEQKTVSNQHGLLVLSTRLPIGSGL